MSKYSIRNNILGKPLIYKWYAWSFLVSPHTASRLFKKKYIPLLESYLENPEFHAQALTQDELAGGPFINVEPSKKHLIENYYCDLKKQLYDHINLSDEIDLCYNLLNKISPGEPLAPLYKDLPSKLRGYIELTYDTLNQPNIKFIEGLLYASQYETSSGQSIAFSNINNDDRIFALNTPDIESHKLTLSVPFENKIYDKIFSSEINPLSKNALEDLYDEIRDYTNADYKDFKSIFSDFNVKSQTPCDSSSELDIKYFGHACLLIQSNNCTILTDPVISYAYNSSVDRFTYDDLPEKIDYVLITHAHQDHIVLEHLIRLRHRIECIVVPKSNVGSIIDPSLKLMLNNIGFNNIIEVSSLERISTKDGEIISIPFLGEHGDLDIQAKTAYYIRSNNKKILCAADSDILVLEIYRKIFAVIEKPDCVFLGMESVGAPLSWVYGEFLPYKLARTYDQARRLHGSNADRGYDLIEYLKPKKVYLYALALEPWLTYLLNINENSHAISLNEIDRFISYCNEINVNAESLYCKKTIRI